MDPNRKSQIAIQYALSPRCTGEDVSARSGTVTPHGKSRSARNAVRHGLLARNLLLDRESTNCFNLLANDLYDEYVDTMIWVSAGLIPSLHRRRHMRPVRTWERSLVDTEIRRTPEPATDLPGNDGCDRAAKAFRTLAEKTSTLNVLNRYETSFDHDRLCQTDALFVALRHLAEDLVLDVRNGAPFANLVHAALDIARSQDTRALRRLMIIREAHKQRKNVKVPNEPTKVLYNQQDDSAPEPENASF